jgi:hypothetical protein
LERHPSKSETQTTARRTRFLTSNCNNTLTFGICPASRGRIQKAITMASLSDLVAPPVSPLPYTPIYWRGTLRRYEFQLDQVGTNYRPIPGVFCRSAGNGLWYPIYVGETGSFQRRLADQLRIHHCWERICLERATHISTLHVPGAEAQRLLIETDLRRALNPPHPQEARLSCRAS